MNNNTDTAKEILIWVVSISAIVLLLTGAIWSVIFNWQNPDMTHLRLFIENPWPTIVGCCGVVLSGVARCLMKYL